MAVYLAHKLCNLLLRVLENVDRFEGLSKVLSFSLNPLSDLFINYIVLVVEILKLDDGDSRPEHVQLKLLQECGYFVDQEKKNIFVIDSLQVL